MLRPLKVAQWGTTKPRQIQWAVVQDKSKAQCAASLKGSASPRAVMSVKASAGACIHAVFLGSVHDAGNTKAAPNWTMFIPANREASSRPASATLRPRSWAAKGRMVKGLMKPRAAPHKPSWTMPSVILRRTWFMDATLKGLGAAVKAGPYRCGLLHE